MCSPCWDTGNGFLWLKGRHISLTCPAVGAQVGGWADGAVDAHHLAPQQELLASGQLCYGPGTTDGTVKQSPGVGLCGKRPGLPHASHVWSQLPPWCPHCRTADQISQADGTSQKAHLKKKAKDCMEWGVRKSNGEKLQTLKLEQEDAPGSRVQVPLQSLERNTWRKPWWSREICEEVLQEVWVSFSLQCELGEK